MKPGIRKADPCVMVIFGASGDLTRRMLIPALCHLALANLSAGGYRNLDFGPVFGAVAPIVFTEAGLRLYAKV